MDKSESVRVHAITHPLRVGGIDRVAPEGVTIAQLMADLEPDPLFADLLEVWVDGEPVERARWEAYRPAAGSLVTVTAFPAPGKGGKDILRAVLTIAVIAISVWAGPHAAGLMGLADSAFAAGMATAGISAAGMLAVNALVPPAKIEAGSTPSRVPTHYIEGARNTLRPYEPVPVHYGRSRYTPPLGARTYTESLGDKQYLRMLVVWGLGPLSVTDMRIGDTPLSDFTNIQIEHRPGLPSDPPLTLFPSSVIQEELSILLSQASGWVTRSSADGAVELSIDLAAPALVMYDSDGDPHEQAVALEVQYCEHGTGAWRHPARADVTTSFEEPIVTVIPIYDPVTASYTGTTTYTRYPGDTWVEGGAEVRTITIRHRRPEALRHGLSWRVPAGRYDVRVRRLTEDTDQDNIFDDIYWAALRTYRADPPVTPPVPLCMTALRIQATDQLDRMVDDLNGIVQSIAPRWDGSAWAARATSCPAALIRRALQGPGVPAPVADEWINLESLQAFAEHCAEHGYEYNEVIQADTSVWDLCSRIAAAGRATFGLVDWGWGVIIDRPRGDLEITTHITPRNSRDFRIEKAFTDLPHAWRVAFANEEQDWRPDEMIVYRDGYGPGTASRFEQLSLPGVTSPAQVYALARYHMAVAVQRPERWVCRQDFEHLVLKRGDRALVTHDVLLVGLASGRVKDIVTDGDTGEITALVLDNPVPGLDPDEAYGISVRTVGDARVTRLVTIDAADPAVARLGAPIPAGGVEPGDLYGFGVHGLETDDALVLAIRRGSDLEAEIHMVPYRPEVYTAADGEIPPFDTRVTPLPVAAPPVVVSVYTDERVLLVDRSGSLRPRVSVEVEPCALPHGRLEAQMRLSETREPYSPAETEHRTGVSVVLAGVSEGEYYDIRLRWVFTDRMPSAWSEINNVLIIGKGTPPAPLEGLSLTIHGNSALMRWDPPPELDVLYGGLVRFRHSPVSSGATWADSVSIGQAAQARGLFAVMPLKEGTYLARVYDVDGRSSEVRAVTTKQASVLKYAAVTSVREDSGWLGAKDGTVAVDGYLRLDEYGSFDEIVDLDAVADLDGFGVPLASGEYYFAAGFDFTTERRVRLTSHISAVCVNLADRIDLRGSKMDTWEEFDATAGAAADCRVYARYTDDDPASPSAAWTQWQRLDSAEVSARGADFKAVLTSSDRDYNIYVLEMGVYAEEVDLT